MRTQLLFVLLIAGTFAAGPATKPTTAPAKPLTFDEIVKSMPKDIRDLLDNATNSVAAAKLDEWCAEHVKGRDLRMKGELTRFGVDSDTKLVSGVLRDMPRVRGAQDASTPHPHATCTFQAAETPAFAKLRNGANVKVHGTIKSFHFTGKSGFDAVLADCELER